MYLPNVFTFYNIEKFTNRLVKMIKWIIVNKKGEWRIYEFGVLVCILLIVV